MVVILEIMRLCGVYRWLLTLATLIIVVAGFGEEILIAMVCIVDTDCATYVW